MSTIEESRWDDWNKDVVMPVTDFIDACDVDILMEPDLRKAFALIPLKYAWQIRVLHENIAKFRDVRYESVCALIRFLLVFEARPAEIIRTTVNRDDANRYMGFRWQTERTKLTLIFDSPNGGNAYVKSKCGVHIHANAKFTQYLANSHKVEKLLGFLL